VEIFELEYCVSFSGIWLGMFFASFWIVTSQRMSEQVPVVVLSISIAGQTEESRDGQYDDCRAVKGVNIAFDLHHRICG
jgi:hypothetical protein